MKSIYNNAFIFSVYKDGLPLSVNQKRHETFLKIIEHIPHKVVEMTYTNKNHSRKIVESIYCQASDAISLKDLRELVVKELKECEQDSYLQLNPDREVILITGKKYKSQGFFVGVHENEAKEADTHFYCPLLKTFYVIK